jgi:hypothetical protein
MKKLIGALLVIMMVFSLAACGGGEVVTEPSTPTPSPTPRTYTDGDLVSISLVKWFTENFTADGLQLSKVNVLYIETDDMAKTLNDKAAELYAGDDTGIQACTFKKGDFFYYMEIKTTNFSTGMYTSYKLAMKTSSIYGDDVVTTFQQTEDEYTDYQKGLWDTLVDLGLKSSIQTINGRVVLQIVNGNVEMPAELNK